MRKKNWKYWMISSKKTLIIKAVIVCVIVLIIYNSTNNAIKRPDTPNERNKELIQMITKYRRTEQINYVLFENDEDFPLLNTIPKGQFRQRLVIADLPHPLAKLGNKIFIFASAFGIAQTLGRNFAIASDLLGLKTVFNLTEISVINPFLRDTYPFNAEFAIYDNSYISRENNADLWTMSYMQSWKYFYRAQSQLRRTLRFNERFQRAAFEHVRYAKQKIAHDYGVTLNDVTLIGVHIRRGDMASDDNKRLGYKVAPLDYFLSAIIHYAYKYIGSNLHFLLVTDDIKWVRQTFPPKLLTSQYITISDDLQTKKLSMDPAIFDLAVLSLCNHTIGSVGTFSWWAGWLTGGDVVMYAKPLLPGCDLQTKGFRGKDFFLPKWTLIDS